MTKDKYREFAEKHWKFLHQCGAFPKHTGFTGNVNREKDLERYIQAMADEYRWFEEGK